MAVTQDTKNRVSNTTKSAAKAAKGLGRFAAYFVLETLLPGEVGKLVRGILPNNKIVFTRSEKERIRKSLTKYASLFRSTDLEPKANHLQVVAGDPTALLIPVDTTNTNLIAMLNKLLAKKIKDRRLQTNEGNFAILLKKKPQGSKDRQSGFVPEVLKGTNKWFEIVSSFVYTTGYASLKEAFTLTELHTSEVLRTDMTSGTKELDENVRTLYTNNGWKYLNDKVADSLVEGIAKKLAEWADKLNTPSAFEQMIMATQMGNYLGLSDVGIKEAKKRLSRFKEQLKYTLGSNDTRTKTPIEVTLELQIVNESSLLYIFDIDPDVPAFRDFSIQVNLAEKEITFTYNNHENNFEKKVKKVAVGRDLDFTKRILSDSKDNSSLWIEFEKVIIETLVEQKGEVLASFIKLFKSMK